MYSFCIPYAFLMYSLCISYAFLMHSLCIPYVFLLLSLCISYVFLMHFLCISYAFSVHSFCILCAFPCIPYALLTHGTSLQESRKQVSNSLHLLKILSTLIFRNVYSTKGSCSGRDDSGDSHKAKSGDKAACPKGMRG